MGQHAHATVKDMDLRSDCYDPQHFEVETLPRSGSACGTDFGFLSLGLPGAATRAGMGEAHRGLAND
jgi:hypothetical protein